MRFLLGVVVMFLGCNAVQAACSGGSPTWTAASIAASDVQACITVASAGDTINVPNGSTGTWANLTDTKGLTLSCPGSSCTITTANAYTYQCPSSGNHFGRITGFTFTSSGNNNNGDAQMNGPTVTGTTCTGRIDHNTFTNSSQSVFIAFYNDTVQVNPMVEFLADHNTMTGGPASEMIHNNATGASNNDGWTNAVVPGGQFMVFIEDNTATNANPSGAVVSFIESYYGAQTVIRHNTLVSDVQIDQHGVSGSTTNAGSRWWDVNNNYFQSNGTNQPSYITLRSGSGVVWGNTDDGTSTHGYTDAINFYFDGTASGYVWPGQWEDGSGIGGVTMGHNSCPGPLNSAPAYVWGNSSDLNNNVGTFGDTGGTSSPQLNRDYFVSSTQPATMTWQEQSGDTCSTTYTYTSYTYPNPLQGGGGGGTVVTPTFSPGAGTYSSTQSVTISTTTGGATLCYTTDGSTPTGNGAGTCTHGTTYSGTVSVSSSLTLQAIGTESGFTDSAVASAVYAIGSKPAPAERMFI